MLQSAHLLRSHFGFISTGVRYQNCSTIPLRKHRCLHTAGGGATSSSSPGAFEYKIAVAFSGKANVFDRNKHHFLFDAETGIGAYGEADLAKRGRKIPSGQDSFFVGPVGNYDRKHVAFAVADGVGGYKDSGIDSADFAHGLCRYMRESAANHDPAAPLPAKPLKVLQEGYDKVCADEKIEGGGSTACVAVANSQGALDVAKCVLR